MSKTDQILAGTQAVVLFNKGVECWNSWAEEHPDWDVDFSGPDFQELNSENRGYSFKGYRFPRQGRVNFSGCVFGGVSIDFTGAVFGSGGLDFLKVKFGEGDVNFSHAIFGAGEVNFTDAEFRKGRVDFSEAVHSFPTKPRRLRKLLPRRRGFVYRN